MKRKTRRLRNGFTLTDLLVVVALAGLIVPLSLFIVRDADQQAGIAKCLSSLGQMMQATSMYLEDYDNEFLFFYEGSNAICTWMYGGKTTDDYWRTHGGGRHYIPVTERPLNPYFLGARVEPDLGDPYQVVERTAIPLLQCPADRVSYQRMFTNFGEEPLNMSTYDDVGTSYQTNLHAMFDVVWNGDSDPWNKPGDWQDYGSLLLRDVLAGQADTFTWYIEGPMDWALDDYNRTIEVGNHGEFGKHSCGYLDGHADYVYRDTRGWCGPGWEAIVTKWIWGYGHVPKPAHYPFATAKRCH